MRNTAIWFFSALVGFVLFACEMVEAPPKQPEKTFQKSTQAVVGGSPDNRLPAVGALTSNRRSFCTGTLLASRLVVTAAHCVTSAQQSINARRTVQFRIDLPTGQGTNFNSVYYDVDIVKTHPQYGRSNGGLQNDVGYVVLKKDVTGVTPVPINTTKLDNSWVGKKVTFLGYGLIQTQPQLRSAGRKYGADITLRRVSGDRIQTQDQGKSICSGDSGGPGLYNFNGVWRIIAVNSYVTGRTSGRQPLCDGSGWSFRVDYYTSWLQPLINQYGGKCKQDKDCGPCYRCDTKQGKCTLRGTAKTADFCKPCDKPAACGASGQNLCQRQSVGNRCLQACDANGCCPLGTSCRIVGGSNQCVPVKNVCDDVRCTVDTDCGPGEQCDKSVCRPKPVKASPSLCKVCKTDADCGGGVCTRYPDGNRCTQPCVADNFCPAGYACKVVNGKNQCVSASGDCKCASNADCDNGFACQGGLCQRAGGGKYGDACSSSRRCAQGYRCTQTTSSGNICIQTCSGAYPAGQPGSVCANNQCSDGARCTPLQGASACLSACRSSADCKNGGSCQRFGGSFSVCICQSDSNCKNGTTCNRSLFGRFGFGLCAKKSSSANQCEKGFECRSAGGGNYCLPGPTQQAGDACNDSTLRCKAGHFCAPTERGNRICIRECRSNNDCLPEGGSCVRSSGFSFCACNSGSCSAGYLCKAISSRNKICVRGGCKSNADCSAGLVCKDGKCQSNVKPECAQNSDCPEGKECRGGKCFDKPECVSDGDCGINQECKEGKCVQKATPTCATNADCPTTYVCRKEKCVPQDSCETNKDCGKGLVCEFKVCVKDTSPPPPEPSQKPDAGGQNNNNNNKPKPKPTPEQPPTPVDSACACSARSGSLPSQSILWLLVLLPFLGMRRRRS